MKAVITHFEPITIQRVAQLTNKTNQFNLTTLRCSEDDIRRMQDDPMHICLCARLIDKFADNGIVTVFAGEIKEQTLHIKLWLMSCRVLKRSMEDFIMNEVVNMAKDKDIKKIVGYYYPTPKNGIVKDFYKDMGFGLVKSNKDGSSVWEVEVSSCEPRKTAIDKDNSSL